MIDLMSPLPRATIGATTFFVDEKRPVAVVRREAKPDLFLTWPEIDIGIFSPTVWVFQGPDALWVVYQAGDVGGDDRYPDLQAPDLGAAVRIDTDGSVGVVRLGGTPVLGATRAGIWSGSSAGESIDDSYQGGELSADWAAPTTLRSYLPGQPPRTLHVDRYVNAVREEDQGHVLFVNPSPPVAHRDSGGITYEYRCTALVLGAVEQWPEEVNFRDYVPQGWGTPVAWERLGLNYDPYEPVHDPAQIDLANMAGSRWMLINLTDAQKTQAAKALTDQFVDADTYWKAPDGTSHPLATGVRETRVDVIGKWPETLVQVTCSHPYFAAGRIRRSMRVFDDAGRIKFDRYASIQFMEDLDTHALPDLGEARNGVLDV